MRLNSNHKYHRRSSLPSGVFTLLNLVSPEKRLDTSVLRWSSSVSDRLHHMLNTLQAAINSNVFNFPDRYFLFLAFMKNTRYSSKLETLCCYRENGVISQRRGSKECPADSHTPVCTNSRPGWEDGGRLESLLNSIQQSLVCRIRTSLQGISQQEWWRNSLLCVFTAAEEREGERERRGESRGKKRLDISDATICQVVFDLIKKTFFTWQVCGEETKDGRGTAD